MTGTATVSFDKAVALVNAGWTMEVTFANEHGTPVEGTCSRVSDDRGREVLNVEVWDETRSEERPVREDDFVSATI